MNVAVRTAAPTEALVLIPGIGADARLFDHQFRALSRLRPVTMALPRGGERVSEIASGLLPHLPQRMALVGHGLGGVIALEILRRAPDRVARIALIAASPFLDTPADSAERETRLVALRTGRMAEWVKAEFGHTIAEPRLRGLITTLLADMAEALGPEVLLAQSRAFLRRMDTQGALRRCAAPVAVIGGDQDPLFPTRRQDVMAGLAPDARLTRIEGAGHFPMLEAPARVIRALQDFMDAPFVLR